MSLALHQLPTGREAPPEVARALRDVDPTAELVYMGDGRWDLLRMRPKNDDRARVAQLMLMNAYRACQVGKLQEHGWYRALRFAHLIREGYVVFGRYRLTHDPDWRIVHEFRRGMWEYLHDHNDEAIEYQWNARERKAEEIRTRFGDRSAAREAVHALNHRVTFTMPGLRGVS